MPRRSQRLNQKLKTNAYEWRHTLLFLDKKSTEGKAESARKTHLNPIIRNIILFMTSIFAYGFTSMIVSDYGENIPLAVKVLLMILTIGAIPLTFIRLRRSYRRFKENTTFHMEYPNKNDMVQLYEVNDEGISINYYNQDDLKSYLKWEDIRRANIITTRYPPIYKNKNNRTYVDEDAMRRKLKQDVEEIKQHYPDYPYREKIKPKDEISLALKGGTLLGVDNILPIPKSWQKDGTLDEFIAYIDKQLWEKNQIKVQPLIEPKEIDLIEKFFPNLYDKYFSDE